MAEVVSMPKLGFDMAEGTLVRWILKEGEKVNKGDILAEIETDKATVEVESPHTGVVAKHLVETGAIVPVNKPISVIVEEGEEIDLAKYQSEMQPEQEVSTTREEERVVKFATEVSASKEKLEDGTRLPGGVRASPLARRIARREGVELNEIRGSGPKGRIIREDVEGFLEEAGKQLVDRGTTVPITSKADRPDQREKISKLRSIIGKRMAESVRTAPHFFVTHVYDMIALMDLRSRINSILGSEEKISVNDFILKAVALALVEFPNLNASIDEVAGEIIRHGSVNVGVAVAVENGLLTVVCTDTDRKHIRQIATELRGLVQRARDGKVRPEDIEGSTFSVSNLGMFEVDQFTAIINPPEAAILAVGAVKKVPVVVDGVIETGLQMKATLSVDHRVSDGVEAARFLQTLGGYLEAPMRLLL